MSEDQQNPRETLSREHLAAHLSAQDNNQFIQSAYDGNVLSPGYSWLAFQMNLGGFLSDMISELTGQSAAREGSTNFFALIGVTLLPLLLVLPWLYSYTRYLIRRARYNRGEFEQYMQANQILVRYAQAMMLAEANGKKQKTNLHEKPSSQWLFLDARVFALAIPMTLLTAGIVTLASGGVVAMAIAVAASFTVSTLLAWLVMQQGYKVRLMSKIKLIGRQYRDVFVNAATKGESHSKVTKMLADMYPDDHEAIWQVSRQDILSLEDLSLLLQAAGFSTLQHSKVSQHMLAHMQHQLMATLALKAPSKKWFSGLTLLAVGITLFAYPGLILPPLIAMTAGFILYGLSFAWYRSSLIKAFMRPSPWGFYTFKPRDHFGLNNNQIYKFILSLRTPERLKQARERRLAQSKVNVAVLSHIYDDYHLKHGAQSYRHPWRLSQDEIPLSARVFFGLFVGGVLGGMLNTVFSPASVLLETSFASAIFPALGLFGFVLGGAIGMVLFACYPMIRDALIKADWFKVKESELRNVKAFSREWYTEARRNVPNYLRFGIGFIAGAALFGAFAKANTVTGVGLALMGGLGIGIVALVSPLLFASLRRYAPLFSGKALTDEQRLQNDHERHTTAWYMRVFIGIFIGTSLAPTVTVFAGAYWGMVTVLGCGAGAFLLPLVLDVIHFYLGRHRENPTFQFHANQKAHEIPWYARAMLGVCVGSMLFMAIETAGFMTVVPSLTVFAVTGLGLALVSPMLASICRALLPEPKPVNVIGKAATPRPTLKESDNSVTGQKVAAPISSKNVESEHDPDAKNLQSLDA